jgi:hypothetical protein
LRLHETERPDGALAIASATVLYEKAAGATRQAASTVAETLKEADAVAARRGIEDRDETTMPIAPMYEGILMLITLLSCCPWRDYHFYRRCLSKT